MDKDLLEANITKVLFEIDPMGINAETNTDEYDAEAYNIVAKLKGTETFEEVAKIVREEFIRTFGMGLAGGKYSKYDKVAHKIIELFRK